MAGQPPCEHLSLAGELGLGGDGAEAADFITLAGAGEGVIEGSDERAAQVPWFRGLITQHVRHVAAPVLVLGPIAEHPDRVGRAKDAGEALGVSEIVRPARRHPLRESRAACRCQQDKAKQASMKTLLLHARTFARIGPQLKAHQARLQTVTLDDRGALHDGWSGAPLAEPPAIDLAFGNSDVFFSAHAATFLRLIAASPALDWFQSAAAGVEHPALQRVGRKVRLYTTNHTQAESMAEWALWQALDFFRAGPAHRAQQAGAVWQKLPQRDFAGSEWLVYGYGSIGEAVGRRVSALGGRVTGVRRRPGPAIGAAEIVAPGAIAAALAQADVVLLCAPHTPETENIADTAFFAAMRPDALFMNLGRGALVDEPALLAALDAGRPAFAALDVTRDEPLPASSPLWRHPRIALTPHDSSNSPATIAGADATFLDNLHRYLAGAPLNHVVARDGFGAE